MRRRKILLAANFALILVGCVVFASVLIQTFKPNGPIKHLAHRSVDVSKIPLGEVKYFEIEGRPLIILKPNKEQLEDLRFLDSHVWNTEYAGYLQSENILAYWGISTRHGCGIKHLPKGVRRGSGDNRSWMGGYFDPCHDPSYDLAGRTIKSVEYSGNNAGWEVPNLNAPIYEMIDNRLQIIRL